jgi:predicted DNA-binding transcriptional regulator AlpA
VADLLSLPSLSADAAGRPVGRIAAELSLAVGAKGVAAMLSGSVRWVRTLDAAGKLPAPVRCAGRVLWIRSEIEAWLNAGAPDRETWTAMRDARK